MLIEKQLISTWKISKKLREVFLVWIFQSNVSATSFSNAIFSLGSTMYHFWSIDFNVENVTVKTTVSFPQNPRIHVVHIPRVYSPFSPNLCDFTRTQSRVHTSFDLHPFGRSLQLLHTLSVSYAHSFFLRKLWYISWHFKTRTTSCFCQTDFQHHHKSFPIKEAKMIEIKDWRHSVKKLSGAGKGGDETEW